MSPCCSVTERIHDSSSVARQSGGSRLNASRIEDAFMSFGNRVLAQDDEHGALPTLYAATKPDLPPGAYVGPDGVGEMRGHPRLVGMSGAAQDETAARRLWEVSEEFTGVPFELTPQA